MRLHNQEPTGEPHKMHPQSSLQPTQPMAHAGDFASLVPLVQQALDNWNKRLIAEQQAATDELTLQQATLQSAERRFNKVVVLVAIIFCAILGIAAGLIFISKDIESGKSLLSSAVLIMLSLVSGSALKGPAKRLWR